MSTPDFPTGTGPIATPSETSQIETTDGTGPLETIGTGPIPIAAPAPAGPPASLPKLAPIPRPPSTGTSPTPPATASPDPVPTPIPDPDPTLADGGVAVGGTVRPERSASASEREVERAPTPTPTPSGHGPAIGGTVRPERSPSASEDEVERAPTAAPTPSTGTREPISDGRQRAKALALARLSPSELERAFLRGVTPDAEALVGWEFRGHNTPPWFRLLGIRKFVKGFYADGDGGVWGYNSPVVQDGVDRPWRLKPSDDLPKRFGFYTVRPVDAAAKDNLYLHALLLDYGKGGNPTFDPSAGLRDYLVQVDRDDPDLLLGKAYYALGPLRVPTFSFFVLDRHRPGPRELARRAR